MSLSDQKFVLLVPLSSKRALGHWLARISEDSQDVAGLALSDNNKSAAVSRPAPKQTLLGNHACRLTQQPGMV